MQTYAISDERRRGRSALFFLLFVALSGALIAVQSRPVAPVVDITATSPQFTLPPSP